MDSNKVCTRHSTNKTFKTKSFESTCPPKNGALAGRGAGGSGRSPKNNMSRSSSTSSSSSRYNHVKRLQSEATAVETHAQRHHKGSQGCYQLNAFASVNDQSRNAAKDATALEELQERAPTRDSGVGFTPTNVKGTLQRYYFALSLKLLSTHTEIK